MSKLLVKPNLKGGPVHAVTPKSAGWTYVGFEVHDLAPGRSLAAETGDMEICLVLVAGKARVEAGGKDFGVIGERNSPFEGSPWSAYVPAKSSYRVTAETPAELAVCAAPARGTLPARVIPPSEVG